MFPKRDHVDLNGIKRAPKELTRTGQALMFSTPEEFDTGSLVQTFPFSVTISVSSAAEADSVP